MAAPDLRNGMSDTAKSPKEYIFNRDVEDIEGLRKALDIEKINLLGHSWGNGCPNAVRLVGIVCILLMKF